MALDTTHFDLFFVLVYNFYYWFYLPLLTPYLFLTYLMFIFQQRTYWWYVWQLISVPYLQIKSLFLNQSPALNLLSFSTFPRAYFIMPLNVSSPLSVPNLHISKHQIYTSCKWLQMAFQSKERKHWYQRSKIWLADSRPETFTICWRQNITWKHLNACLTYSTYFTIRFW